MMLDKLLVRRRFVLQACWDSAAWVLAMVIGTALRYEFKLPDGELRSALFVGGVAALLQVVLGAMIGLYVHRWRYGTFEEAIAVTRTTVIVAAVTVVANRYLLGHAVPVSATFMATAIAHLGMMTGRIAWRWVRDSSLLPHEGAERVIVFGAGEGGAQVVRSMFSPASPYQPVALLDDNKALGKLRIKSIAVQGGRERIAEVAERTGATKMVVAIPSASGELIRDLLDIADAAGLETLVLPPVADLFGTMVGYRDMRPVSTSDLLGRREINTDIESVAHYLRDKRVLVTGAGGSIGSELCRQLHRFAPTSVVMLDRDESALQALQVSIDGHGLLDSPELVIASIRDLDRMREVFATHRPEVVFHAAALKHLTLLEQNPDEGFKTNVIGTHHLLQVAKEFGVETFVNISTDKAAAATSVLGSTKRMAERLTAFYGEQEQGKYISVRFGNVLGSRGSVLPLFLAQIEAGGPVTVTDRDVTRFFMTIEEACQLVIQAGAIGETGEVMVLEMGEPVRIADLAKRLIAESGRKVKIEYTGLRPGEKTHEVLFGPDERPVTSSHEMIMRVKVPALDPASLPKLGAPMVVDLTRVPPTLSSVPRIAESA